jgi:hypothetical protein
MCRNLSSYLPVPEPLQWLRYEGCVLDELRGMTHRIYAEAEPEEATHDSHEREPAAVIGNLAPGDLPESKASSGDPHNGRQWKERKHPYEREQWQHPKAA